jgi:MOSC domain-containing protein YiiM
MRDDDGTPLPEADAALARAGGGRVALGVVGRVEAIFITEARSGQPQPVDAVEAIAGIGLARDRYGDARAHTYARRRCQVTLIEAEHLAKAAARFAAGDLAAGIHRRNIVTSGVRLLDLADRLIMVGEAVLAWDRRRPPCRRLDDLAQGPLGKALGGWGGICTRVVGSGLIRPGDPIRIIGVMPKAGAAVAAD